MGNRQFERQADSDVIDHLLLQKEILKAEIGRLLDENAALKAEVAQIRGAEADINPDEYYLQDKRNYVGNDMLFWAKGGGYTTDLRKAEVFALDAAIRQQSDRNTDIPWPRAYIHSKSRPTVDMQHVKRRDVSMGATPKFEKTLCSSCGGEFGPGDHGYSYCSSHAGKRRIG